MGTAGGIRALLIANRGEIACRIARTCRRLGITSIAVYSEADADALHVRTCDLAVSLPGTAPSDTYLRIDLVVDAARRAGADAIHPGYGFLAENAEFASAVIDAGITWVGPPPSAIATMGSKVEAKARMRAAGVPVLPDSSADDLDAIGFPMLVKASAGGGGRGMRVVRDAEALDDALAAAEREALAAFGDGAVFCERYVERGRHIEVQVVADTHGTVASLFERECSIQRRHQKIVEEAPSPVADPGLRKRLCEAGVRVAHDVGYVGAGTVEFLLDEHGEFWFLEMNTRLQVEHPVTEMVTGLDLVEVQLRVAEGHPLPASVLDAELSGHAIEVRLTAEDPAAGYLPATGTMHRFEIGDAGIGDARIGHGDGGLRVDTGVASGSEVSPYYDSMVAKVIAHGPTRDAALARLRAALASARVHGPTTNLEQLRRILDHPEFAAGRLHTGFLDEYPCIAGAGEHDDGLRLPAIAAATVIEARARAVAPVLTGLPTGWRNNPAVDRAMTFRSATFTIDGSSGTSQSASITVSTRGTGEWLGVRVESCRLAPDRESSAIGSADEVVLLDAGIRTRFAVDVVEAAGTPADPFAGGAAVYVHGPAGSTRLTLDPRFPEAATAASVGSLVAPLPGAIRRVHVAAGDDVQSGDPLVALEAMKMEHVVSAPAAGTVLEVLVAEGQQVDGGQALLRLGEPEP